MKRLSTKLVLIGVFVMFLTSAIPNILWTIFGDGERPTEVRPWMLLIGGFITVTFAVGGYTFILEKTVIKRVKRLNEATKEVMNGNYDIHMKDLFRDEVSELVRNFNKMAEELQQNEYLNKEFIRNFSHEIKTPLAAIKGYTELLEHDTISKEEHDEYTSIIKEESKRLSSLSQNMLLISQLEHTVIITDIKEFNITEQIRNVIQNAQLRWEEKQQVFQLDVTDCMITSNKELTYHVFSNLIENAITFSQIGDSIEIRTSKQEEMFICTIANPGTLTEEEQTHLFDLFYIKDQSRFHKSNGIGLTLVQRIIEKLKGTITVSSSNNQIVFKITLPLLETKQNSK